MYVREARRMISEVVMTEKHCVGTQIVADGIGLAAYTMDSHNTQRVVVKDANGKYQVKNEGDVQMGLGGLDPYPISYRALLPRKSECTNLLVPVCLSASHIAFGSIRMEPVFMVLAQSAATAAVLAIDSKKKGLHEVDVTKLQEMLKSNPLADGSLPEILIDNSYDGQFSVFGEHIIMKKQYGRYGKDYVKIISNGQATFSTIVSNACKYNLQVYFPKSENNSKNVKIIVKIGNKIIEKQFEIDANENDWYNFGEMEIASDEKVSVTISSLSDAGFIADAILFVPIK
jgi:hypothetical protein